MPHLCQTDLWAEFKNKTGVAAVKAGDIWFTVHKLPGIFKALPYKVGYCPKVNKMSEKDWDFLSQEGRKQHCAFITVESNVVKDPNERYQIPNTKYQVIPASRTFASHTFLVDLTKSEDELLTNLHPKTRYNIKVAEKHGVVIEEKNGDEGLAIFLKLQRATTNRQHFYIHPDVYYQTLWSCLGQSAHILIASIHGEPVSALFLVKSGDTFYYPYGGSIDKYKEAMAPTLLMWEAVKLGKSLGCKVFDMWGASGSDDPKDPWAGFTRFKKGFGGKLVEFEDTYDLVLNKPTYYLLKLGNKIRWVILRIRHRIS